MLFDINFAMRMNKQPKNFVLDKPLGTDFYIFIQFLTPAQVLQGTEILTASPNACILFAPHQKQYFGSAGGAMIHNWIRFSCSDETYFAKRGIQTGFIFYPRNVRAVSSLFSEIEENILEMPKDYRQKNDTLLQNFFEKFDLSDGGRDIERLREARRLMQRDPAAFCVSGMARQCGFSADHFTRLYKREFGITPQKDILENRMELADNMLLHTDIKIAQIASECGYAAVEQFSRIFKKMRGISPEIYRLTGESMCDDDV